MASSSSYTPLSSFTRPNCFACSSNSQNHQQLRFHLNQLHAEADSTRTQAKRARLRLMRLSESAERLKRQAYVSLHAGKENEARELLFQKKKVMLALERLKSRIELLDKLSAKLNEAINTKEDQLMGNIALDLQVGSIEDASGAVGTKSAIQVAPKDAYDDDKSISSDALSLAEHRDFQLSMDDVNHLEMESISVSRSVSDINSARNGLEDISCYEDFLEHLDLQFNKTEAELAAILNVSALVLNDSENLQNPRVRETLEILESIRAIRKKITNIKQSKMENR